MGDYDGDGRLDLLLTGYHSLALLRNEEDSGPEIGGGIRPSSVLRLPSLSAPGQHRSSVIRHPSFRDVTREAGLDPHNRGHWGSSAGFMDLTGSGRLDLVLLNYVVFGPKEPQYCELIQGVRSGCPPRTYRPEFPELWKNAGSGRFVDVTSASGLRATHGKALVLAFADVDGDGRMDFYIGNDGEPADLMRNLGGLRFRNVALQSNVAYDASDKALAAMAADWADYDRDGRLDLVVTGFSNESYAVYHAEGKGLFKETSDALGIAGPTYKPLGFGAKWIDLDNDGWPDIVFANGHVYDNAQSIDPLSSFRQPLMIFHNLRGKEFVDRVPRMDGEAAEPILGRGLASGDFDNDGRVDFLVVDYEGEPRLFHNVSPASSHWITLDLRARQGNRFAYGAQVRARAGDEQWVGQVSPASSYLSSSDPRVHFGLGQTRKLDSLAIRWPDGRSEKIRDVAADRILRVEEGQAAVVSSR